MDKFFNFKRFFYNFGLALFAIKRAFFSEQSFRFQILGAVFIIALAFLLPLKTIEWAILILTIGAVLGFELLNSQMEKILDIVQPKNDPLVKKIKDFSSAAVLIVAIGSVLVGLIIFLPRIMDFFIR